MTLWLMHAWLAQDVTGNLEQDNSTTAREKIRFAGVALAEMKQVRQELDGLYQDSEVVDARLCLADELADLDGLIEVGEASTMAIPDALAAGEQGQAEQEFRKISVALMRARGVRERGFACAALPASDTEGWSGQQGEPQPAALSED